MSVIIFFSASKKKFFAEMMCKQLLFCVKAATRRLVLPLNIYTQLAGFILHTKNHQLVCNQQQEVVTPKYRRFTGNIKCSIKKIIQIHLYKINNSSSIIVQQSSFIANRLITKSGLQRSKDKSPVPSLFKQCISEGLLRIFYYEIRLITKRILNPNNVFITQN